MAPLGRVPGEALLKMSGITKVFAGTMALSTASLYINRAEIHGLLGENGAGKSTLIKILAGVLHADVGETWMDGVRLPDRHDPRDAAAAGIAILHQDFGLVGDMSVTENICLGIGFPRKGFAIDWKASRRLTQSTLDRLAARVSPDNLVSELPIGSRALVAIARAVVSKAKLLVLDEPTATLTAAEVSALFGVLRELVRSGVGCVFVSHRLDEVHAICDRVTVLRDGRTVGTAVVADTEPIDVIRMIVGHDFHKKAPAPPAQRDLHGGLRVEGLEGLAFGPVSFEAGIGETLGLTGLSDSGCFEIGGVLFGRYAPTAGKVTLRGKSFAPTDARSAIAAGVAFVPADRNAEGIVQTMSLRENLNINPGVTGPMARTHRDADEPQVGSFGRAFVDAKLERRVAAAELKRYDVRPSEPEREASTLSGGNAQKLLLARWLSMSPSLLVLNEPTAGVDVGAREEIHNFIRAAAKRGAICLVISSDYEEIAQVCDRTLVFGRGKVRGELIGSELTAANITVAALSPAGVA